MKKCVLFDLDGTLINSYRGIYNSYKYSCDKLNIAFPGDLFINKVIGAPLFEVFNLKFNLSKEVTKEAIKFYREYYSKIGKNEVEIYSGVNETLKLLKDRGYLLGVATLKKETFAIDILKKLNIIDFFDIVCGMDNEDTVTKAILLSNCMNKLNINNDDVVLIGDSEYDLKGAEEVNIDFIAALYGFGFNEKNVIKDLKIINNICELMEVL